MQLYYIDLKYQPKKTELLAAFYVEPHKMTLPQAAEHVALESSIGSWTEIKTMNPRIAHRLKPHVYSINKRTNVIRIAYPIDLFEAGSIPQITSALCGNILGMKMVNNLRVLDLSFPKSLVRSFKGPRYGIPGIRKLLKIRKRPLVGTIVKPKVGLTAKQHAQVAYESWVGGLDIVKDDENLTSHPFNSFKDRMKLTIKAKERAEHETGEKKVYLANVTAETDEMKKRERLVRDLGNEYLMIDFLTTGFGAFQTMRNHTRLAIHVHRAMHGAFTRNPRHGISMLVLAKIVRLIGGDQLHIGTAGVGKMEGLPEEERAIQNACTQKKNTESEKHHVLHQDWFGMKPVLPVASGGLHPGLLPEVVHRMGLDIVIQAGAGVHGHPWGTEKGARAMRQAAEAVTHEIPLETYAEAHRELKESLKQWGRKGRGWQVTKFRAD